MLDPFETFDPYADESATTQAALYGSGCGPEWPDPLPWEINP